jgi:UDP-N-acetylmuramoylalanine--D-glutamate ligase
VSENGFSVAGRRVVVVGAARSGIAAARLLASKGATVVLTERRDDIDDRAALEDEGVQLELGGHRAETLRAADLIVLSQGVPPFQELFDDARQRGTEIIGELELASRWLQGSIVAITGTKGKSTTTTLVGHMLEAGGVKAMVGGNLGTAASLQVSDTAPDVVHVLEVSSFQLEIAPTFRASIAVLLNFSPDHLDRHRSLEEYAAAKARIFANQQPEDRAIVNVDDPMSVQLARTRARLIPFSSRLVPDEGAGVRDGFIVRHEAGEMRRLVPLSSIRLIGAHLVTDVIAAATAADACGVPADAMTHAVEQFHGLEHALEPVATIDGVRFVNDSKATNLDAARRAIESFDGGVVAIMGGLFKGGDTSVLLPALSARARAVIAIGEARERFRSACERAVDVLDAATLHDAVRLAWERARPDGVVLLAPGCASFDMFRDYADRGRQFKGEVAQLAREHGAMSRE